MQVVCGGGDAKRAVVVAGRHATGRWHATGRGASNGAAREGAGGKGGGGGMRRGWRPIVGWDAWVGGEGEGAGRAWVIGGSSWWLAMGHVTCDGLVSW